MWWRCPIKGRVIDGLGGRFLNFLLCRKSFKVKMKPRERRE